LDPERQAPPPFWGAAPIACPLSARNASFALPLLAGLLLRTGLARLTGLRAGLLGAGLITLVALHRAVVMAFILGQFPELLLGHVDPGLPLVLGHSWTRFWHLEPIVRYRNLLPANAHHGTVLDDHGLHLTLLVYEHVLYLAEVLALLVDNLHVDQLMLASLRLPLAHAFLLHLLLLLRGRLSLLITGLVGGNRGHCQQSSYRHGRNCKLVHSVLLVGSRCAAVPL
jgi:hypothetical protein